MLTDDHKKRLALRGKSSRSVNTQDLLAVLKVSQLSDELIQEVEAYLASEDLVLDLDKGTYVHRTPKRRKRSRKDPSKLLNRAGAIDTDPMKVYLHEIGEVPLLSASEEVAIAQRIQAGSKASEEIAELMAADGWSKVSAARKRELRQIVSSGEAATQALTSANLRLVVSIAKKYLGRGLPILDLVQEGNLGLMRAVQKFDPEKGFKFSTYATWWIRQSVSRALADQSRTIRVPIHMVESINRVSKVKRALEQLLEREPTLAEIAEETDMTVEKVSEILQIMKQDPMSLDTPIGLEEDSTLSDFVPADQPALVDYAAKNLLRSSLKEVLDSLPERDAEVLRMRFGLGDGRPRTLEEVGNAFGVTRERIRQIESRTLAKLRHPLRSDGLRDYLL